MITPRIELLQQLAASPDGARLDAVGKFPKTTWCVEPDTGVGTNPGMNVLVSTPAIAALTGRHRTSVHELMRLGKYGETVLVDGVRYAALDRVEQRHGVVFSDEQITAAVAGLQGRIIRIPTPEEVA